MKVNGIVTAPSLDEFFTRMVKKRMTTKKGDVVTNHKPKAIRAKKGKKPRKIVDDYQAVADAVAKVHCDMKNEQARKEWATEQKREIMRGRMNPKYWEACTVSAEDFFESACVATFSAKPRAYAYERLDMQRTETVYGEGFLRSAPSRYEGAVVEGKWIDQAWVWKRTKFELAHDVGQFDWQPFILVSDSIITATATTRGARPFFSTVVQACFGTGGTQSDTNKQPPVRPAVSEFWRYIVPKTSPPYFFAQVQKKAQVIISQRATRDNAGLLSQLVVKSGVRPLLGREFNNNLSVRTAMTETLQLWQIKKVAQSVNFATSFHGYQGEWIILSGDWSNGTVRNAGTAEISKGDGITISFRWDSTIVISSYMSDDGVDFGSNSILSVQAWIYWGGLEIKVAQYVATYGFYHPRYPYPFIQWSTTSGDAIVTKPNGIIQLGKKITMELATFDFSGLYNGSQNKVCETKTVEVVKNVGVSVVESAGKMQNSGQWDAWTSIFSIS